MYRKTEAACVFFTGATAYTLIEMMWRGYSHPTMTVTGGVCMLVIHGINHSVRAKNRLTAFLMKCAVSAICITFVELCVGVIVNMWLGLGVWDYSSVPGNVLGQICPAYSAAWFGVSAAAILLSDVFDLLFEAIEKRENRQYEKEKI